MKKITTLFIVATILFSQSSIAFGAQLSGGPLTVTEQKVTVDVDTNDTGVILEVYDQANKRVAGPTTTNGNPGKIKASITITNLIRGTTYTLRGKDKNPNSDGDTFETSFTTVNASTPTGTGTFYYSRENKLGFYPPAGGDINQAFFRFTKTEECTSAWQKDIDNKFRTSSNTDLQAKITECFNSPNIPTVSEFRARMKTYMDFDSSVPLYYFTYKTATKDWARSDGHDSLEKCKEWEKMSSAYGIIATCTGLSKPPTEPPGWRNAPVNPIEDDSHGVGDGSGNKITNIYRLLAPIGNETTVDTSQNIGSYFSTIFKLAIGLCGALAVVMIVIHAIQYMGTDSVFGKGESKGKITNAIVGLLIAIGSFAILNTINPDLLGKNALQVEPISIELKSLSNMSDQDYELITGQKLKSLGEYDQIARTIAKEKGIPYCAMRVILERESKSKPTAIGNDANVLSGDIPARRQFIASRQKYSGQVFDIKGSVQEAYTDRDILNDDTNGTQAKVTNTDDLGLDWRFSHGIGLTQATCKPKSQEFSKRKQLPNCIFGMNPKSYTPKELLNAETNLRAGADVFLGFYNLCKKNIPATWAGYGGGGCTPKNEFMKKEVAIRTNLYNQCISQNPS